MSGLVVPEREFCGRKLACDMDDNTLLLLDFGDAFFAYVYGAVIGRATEGFQPNLYGTEGSVVGTAYGTLDLKLPHDLEPHHVGAHAQMDERHVYEDIMQLVDWIREGVPSPANAEHARHVIEIVEAGYRAAETGCTQELRTSFQPLPLETLAELPPEGATGDGS